MFCFCFRVTERSCSRELLNHHWKVIRKLAGGPEEGGRTDCALPSTMAQMKWKQRGSDRGALLTSMAPKFSPRSLCEGVKDVFMRC